MAYTAGISGARKPVTQRFTAAIGGWNALGQIAFLVLWVVAFYVISHL